MTCNIRSITRVLVTAILALMALPAAAQTRTWGQLTTNSGPSPYDWEIAGWIDQYFQDGNPGDGIVSSNMLYMETQCYEEAADNFNATTGDSVGDAATDTVSFTNTTYLAAQRPGVTSYYHGYHDDAAFGLLPGRTAAQVHASGADGRNPKELPRIRGNFFRKVGGASSTHILVWAGQPNDVDYLDVANILLNFEDHPNTTVDILYGNGTTNFGAGATSVGAATRANLRSKLQDIGQRMDDGSDEQFIMFITDHGSSPYVSPAPAVALQNNQSAIIELTVPESALLDALGTPDNDSTVTFTTPTNLDAIGPNCVGFDYAGQEFFGYNGQATKDQLTISGTLLYTYTFPVSESILNTPRAKGDGPDFTQPFGVSNFTGQTISIEHVILSLGAIPRPEGTTDNRALAAVARAPGSGTDFVTRWDLANVGGRDADIELTYTPRADIGGQPVTVTTTVAAGVLREIEDPLGELFGLSSGAVVGAVQIRPTGGGFADVHLHSTVTARKPNGAEYGQFFPAVDSSQTILAGQSDYFTTVEDGSRYRVNAGVMALSDNTTVLVRPYGTVLQPLHDGVELDLDAGESAQINDLDSTFSLAGRSNYLVRMDVSSGSATGYVSVLDGRGSAGTSDPTTVLRMAQSPDRVTLLELGSIVGLNEFSGSAILTNRGFDPATVRADFYSRGTPGIRASANLQLVPARSTGYSDFVNDVFGIQGEVGTVVLTVVDGGPIAATGREFAIFRNGAGAITGTAGQRIAGLRDQDLLDPGRAWHFVGLRQRETSVGSERSHLAVFNPGQVAAELAIALFDGATGAAAGTLQRTVEPGQLIQINNIVSTIDPGQNGGVKRLELVTTEPVFAEAFRVNPTGDPITIDPR